MKFAACHRVADDKKGEGPRSGGGDALSGAGAKRKEGVQPPGDPVQEENRQFTSAMLAEGNVYWGQVQKQVGLMPFGEASKHLCKSAALLLRVASASYEDDAIAAQRWLQSMGVAAAIAALVAHELDETHPHHGDLVGDEVLA
ncbi:hypothetical protein GL58_21485 [Comamonas testosteroni]|uniref:Uncharacterized protein n=1 Tax=Comamonas testosteroni TaxID=285 RepID=A0A0L7N8X4_COMTE|nr:hypothetical protein GL58_21485 [Comamonas testosteroni]